MKSLGLTICCILALGVACFAQPNYAVLIQESPAGAGEIKPGMGIQTFNANEVVTLTTVPNPGWHFVYWMGDVSDPTANRTMTAVNGPKIIIAVFTRDEYELLDSSAMKISSGPGGLTPRFDAIGGSGGGGGGGGDGDGGDGEIPEPQTIIMLSVGAWICYKKRLLGRNPRINRHHPHRGPGPRNP